MIVRSRHSPSDIAEELALFLDGTFCLGHLGRLVLLGSPFLSGSVPEGEELAHEYSALSLPGVPLEDFIALVERSLAAAWRALEIIPERGSGGVDVFSPEWFADVLSGVSSMCPGESSRQILWEMPLCRAFHLLAGRYRRFGKSTRRPPLQEDLEAAFTAADEFAHEYDSRKVEPE